jgi:hypothetical protein
MRALLSKRQTNTRRAEPSRAEPSRAEHRQRGRAAWALAANGGAADASSDAAATPQCVQAAGTYYLRRSSNTPEADDAKEAVEPWARCAVIVSP